MPDDRDPMKFFSNAPTYLTSDGRKPETREDYINATMTSLQKQYGPFSEKALGILEKDVSKQYDRQQANIHAVKAEESALQKSGKRLGPDHPSTMALARNLSKLEGKLGKEMLEGIKRQGRLAERLQNGSDRER